MTADRRSIQRIVKDLRQIGTDTQDIEVKESVQRLPSSLPETLSAFSNGSGGTIILGLSENADFTPAPGFRAKAMADSLATTCSSKLTPPVRPEVQIVEYSGAMLVIAHVPELMPKDKPCYITEHGVYHGSFIRVSDGDRRLSSYEVDRLLEDRAQPTHDIEVIEEAQPEDLDQSLVMAVLARQRLVHPRIFAALSDEDALVSLHVLARDDEGSLHPTLAGLLALGTYPQRFFPRLTVTFTAYGDDAGQPLESKYLDAQTMAGPIPAILEDTLSAVRRNMRVGGSLDSTTLMRVERPDYPLPAVREAVANALMHRDYSPLSRGTAVQVNLYPDRLEITSPGGLYGTVTVEQLGQPGYSSARNQFLASLLETTPYQGGFLVENRGTGYRLIQQELERAGMGAPEVRSSISMFSITMRRAAPAVFAANLETTGEVASYLSGVERASAADIAAATGLPRSTVNYRLRKLMERGVVERLGEPRSPRQEYRLVR